jgi:hypothetical protein
MNKCAKFEVLVMSIDEVRAFHLIQVYSALKPDCGLTELRNSKS